MKDKKVITGAGLKAFAVENNFAYYEFCSVKEQRNIDEPMRLVMHLYGSDSYFNKGSRFYSTHGDTCTWILF